MGIEEQIIKGLELMLLGMGTVFVFLAILVGSVVLMSRFAGWIEARMPPQAELPKTVSPVTAGAGQETMAVISAAVHRYRANR
ncbi:MAG: OadG family protein [Magnetococcales bacterium]|nr:OadG family protein [Magnetococcales bacterium]